MELDIEERTTQVINDIIALAESIGWSIALPDIPDDDLVDHIVIGTLGALTELDKTMDCYSIYVPPATKELKN